MFEKYYSAEQMQQLEQRAKELGEEGMARAQQEWAQLIEEVRAELDAGTPADSERLKPLVARWKSLIEQFTGGDHEIEKSLKRMYEQEGSEKASQGAVDSGLQSYMGEALRYFG